ncbi:MAG TPA: hypothetical protein VN329_04435 [Roseomonas sp.]|nr:hypothetical protein [Roseomonas sp.]
MAGLVLLLGLGACSTTQYPMPYAAPPGVVTNRPPGPVARVTDVQNTRRAGRESSNWIGTIRGGYGNPLKYIEADRPVNDVVRAAVDEALAARGWLAPQDPRVEVLVTVRQFDANRYVRLEATAEIELALRARGSDRVLWRETERVYTLTGSIMAMDGGIFASTAELHALMVRTMNEAIDKLLDRPGFATALFQATQPGV